MLKGIILLKGQDNDELIYKPINIRQIVSVKFYYIVKLIRVFGVVWGFNNAPVYPLITPLEASGLGSQPLINIVICIVLFSQTKPAAKPHSFRSGHSTTSTLTVPKFSERPVCSTYINMVLGYLEICSIFIFLFWEAS